ncbi:hypothetical protein COCC4DRAFT_28477 [Bipolaris maydis ATCC 48331]|uniref:Uncharacterized protein n=2 Tax=Cochliobolus heterostrophus TaxID=5016 RepID=M2SIJ5_COCH5|nr:uncharacterized protein COCC4DRAFT_28477 [Bipolaris maydis ATCC 48331]EMD85185.1 hypothetical protein COCHEDRAFT_1035715 [Bipolaris maydis C5]ENH99356.1 hypothetical protein COCC4DRAFT_28477 [Bipolaris maydis ATCC 48331]
MHCPFAMAKHLTTLSMHRNLTRAQPDLALCLCKVYTADHVWTSFKTYACTHLADSSHPPSTVSLAPGDHATEKSSFSNGVGTSRFQLAVFRGCAAKNHVDRQTRCQTSKAPTLMTCTSACF